MYCRTTALENNLLKSTSFLVFTVFIRNKPAVGTRCDTKNRKLEKFIKTLVKYSIHVMHVFSEIRQTVAELIGWSA